MMIKDMAIWPEDSYPLHELTEKIIAAAIKVHRELGPGYLEKIYERSLAIELRQRDLFVESQVKADVLYCGQVVGRHQADLLVGGQVVVELKSVQSLAAVHEAQLRSTLKAIGKRVGLLLNFNQGKLVDGLRRVIN